MDPTRERLLDAAGQAFAERGYRAATIREISRRAKVNIAAINYHFRDKEHLYIEAVKRAHRSRIEEVPLPEWAPGTPPARKLKDFIRMLLNRLLNERSPEWYTQLMMREIFQPTAACVEVVREYIGPTFSKLLEVLDEVLPEGASASVRHRTAFSIVGQCTHYRLARPIIALLLPTEEFKSYDVDTLAEHISTFTLRALGLDSSTAGMREGA